MPKDNPALHHRHDPRQETVLAAAVTVFARYGFRKASMDEVARAAGISRQGLYLQFVDKEDLFRKAVEFSLGRQLSAALEALANESDELEARLIAACDGWAGRYVGTLGADAADLMCASTSLAGATLVEHESRFESALAKVIGDSRLAAVCANRGLQPAEVAHALHATCRGLKHCSQSRQEFVRGITVAVQLFCGQAARSTRPPASATAVVESANGSQK